MVEAARQVQPDMGFGVGYSMLKARDGRAVCTLRYYNSYLHYAYWCGNRSLDRILAHAPGQAARKMFAVQLAEAEGKAKVNNW